MMTRIALTDGSDHYFDPDKTVQFDKVIGWDRRNDLSRATEMFSSFPSTQRLNDGV